MKPLGYAPPAELKRLSMSALLVGAVFTLLLVIGAFIDRGQFFHAYLVGFIFWTGITLGSLALLMLQHLTGGAWGLVIRRVLEASTQTLPLMLILFIPIIFGLKQIYPWTNPAYMHATAALQQKARFLNPSFSFCAACSISLSGRCWRCCSTGSRWNRIAPADKTHSQAPADDQRARAGAFDCLDYLRVD